MYELPPVLDVLHHLVGWEKVAGAIQDGSISDISGSIIIAIGLTAELPRVNGSGAEGAVTAFPYSLLHLSLDGHLQVISLLNLRRGRNYMADDMYKQDTYSSHVSFKYSLST